MLIKKREEDKKKEEEEKIEAHRAIIKKKRRDERLAQKAAEAAARAEEGGQASREPAITAETPPPKVAAKRPRRRLAPALDAVESEVGESKAFVTASVPQEDSKGSFGPTLASTGAAVPLVRSRSQGDSKQDLHGSTGVEQAKDKAPRRRRVATIAEEGSVAVAAKDESLPGRRLKSAAESNLSTGEGKPVRLRRERSKTEVDDAEGKDADLQRNLDALDEGLEEDKRGKQRRLAAMSAREKIDAQLQAVAEQRRQAAEEEKKNQVWPASALLSWIT